MKFEKKFAHDDAMQLTAKEYKRSFKEHNGMSVADGTS